MTFGERGWKLVRWMDLHANDLAYGRWLAVGKEDVGTDWMNG